MLCRVGIGTVDAFHLQECQISLSLLRRSHLAKYGVAGSQIESLDLRWRHIDVIRTIEVVPVLAPQKAVAFRQDLQHPFAAQDDVRIEQALFDSKDQILLSEPRVAGDIELLGDLLQLGNAFPLELGDVHGGWLR